MHYFDTKDEYKFINKLIASFPDFIDLTNAKHNVLIQDAANTLIEKYNSQSKINELEDLLIDQNNESLVFMLLALKIAKSKIIVNEITHPITISVVLAVYKEHNRIKENSEHPHGEDFLRKKVSQLDWLFNNLPNFKWELNIVDDGCPENSGKIAQDIIDKHNLNNKVKVLFLKEAIEQSLPITKNLSSTKESQKGGSIAYGMWYAAQQSKDKNHIIVYTDADLSTHLGQLGLLLEPILKQNKSVAIGSRRAPKSVVIKKGARNNRGKLFIYLWKRLLPILSDIVDTQCGFKAFRREIVNEVIDDLIEPKFAFDIELLLKVELINRNSIAKIPIAWIDSEQASTTTDLQPYLPMLKSIARMYRKYLPSNQVSDEFATFIESINVDDFYKILNNIPSDIIKREATEFTEYDRVSVTDLTASIS